ncbi:hypothetical protein ACFQU7_28830 [Pseudoroseomonas wenyumeiae]
MITRLLYGLRITFIIGIASVLLGALWAPWWVSPPPSTAVWTGC